MRCIKYWLRLLKLPDQRMPKPCYKMLKNLDENGRKTLANDVKLLLQGFGFNFVWMQQGLGQTYLSLGALMYLKNKTQQPHHLISFLQLLQKVQVSG